MFSVAHLTLHSSFLNITTWCRQRTNRPAQRVFLFVHLLDMILLISKVCGARLSHKRGSGDRKACMSLFSFLSQQIRIIQPRLWGQLVVVLRSAASPTVTTDALNQISPNHQLYIPPPNQRRTRKKLKNESDGLPLQLLLTVLVEEQRRHR